MTVPIQANLYSLGFGTRTSSPPIFSPRPPSATDVQYNLGQFWVDTTAGNVYCLVNFSTSNNVVSANFALLGSEAGALNTLTTQDLTVVSPSAGNINISGAANQLTTTGSGSTVTIGLVSSMITPGSLEVTGLLTCDASALIKTAGTALNLATDSDTAAVNIATVGARTTSIGDTTGASGMVLKVGTGNFSLDGVAGSTYAVGASTTTGTITIGGTAQTGNIVLGSSSGTNSVLIGNGAGVTTVAVAAGAGANVINLANGNGGVTITAAGGTGGNTVSINNGVNASPNVVNISSGAAGADSTVNILNGAASAGTQTINIAGAGATRAVAVNIGTGAAAHVVTIGSTTASASLSLQSGSGGNTSIAGNAAATITIGAAAQTGKISIADSTAAMPAVDLMNGVATGAQVLNIASGTSASGAQTVNLLNGTTPGASTTLNIMNGAASAGTQTVSILSTGATRAGAVNIGNGAAAHLVTIGSTNGAAATTIQAGTGGLALSAAGAVSMVPATNSAAGTSLTLNARVGQATFTGQTTASGSSQAFAITNSVITGTTQAIFVSADNLGSNDAQMTITRVLQAASTLTVTLKNNGAAALNGDVHINFWILN